MVGEYSKFTISQEIILKISNQFCLKLFNCYLKILHKTISFQFYQILKRHKMPNIIRIGMNFSFSLKKRKS